MSLTVAEALQLDIFRQADAAVVAGVAGLDADIRWVHISEQPDIARYLKGGELLFTTGMGLGQNSGLQRRYIRRLAEVGVAAVLFRLGGVFREVPAALVAEAEERQLPIVALRRRIGAIELTEQIHTALVGQQYDLIQRAEQIGETFSELVIEGADLRRVLRRLAEITQNPVVLEDSAHQVVEYGAHTTSRDEVLDAWEGHSRAVHGGEGVGRVHFAEGDPGCLWAPVRYKGQRVGRVHLLQVERRFGELDRLALDRAAAAVALTLLADAEGDHLTDRACRALISDVLVDHHGEAREFFKRASACRADLQDRRLAALVAVPHGLADLADRLGLRKRDRASIRDVLLREMRSAIAGSSCVGVCGLDQDRVLAIVGVQQQADLRAQLEAIGQRFCALVEEKVGGLALTVGASNEASVVFLKRALEEASEVADSAREGKPDGRVLHFGDLGLDHLLIQLGTSGELARFVESELGPLLEHDRKKRSRLLETLQAYLAHGGRKSETARALSIERRSLYHRLDRLGAVLDRDLEDEDTRFRLWFALRALNLLKRRTPH